MQEQTAYSRLQVNSTVNAAAFLGWLAIAGPEVVHSPDEAILFMSFGFPVAFGTCWLIGAPILRLLMQRPVSWVRASVWGGVIAGLIAVVFIFLSYVIGWQEWQNPQTRLMIGSRDAANLLDGLQTWDSAPQLVLNVGQFILLGVAIALILRALIGPGQNLQRGQ